LDTLPYNVCDYRCERCLETTRCAVYQRLQEQSMLNRLHGRNENDAQGILNELRESFRETERLIKQKAQEFGIDLDQITGGATPEAIREERRAITEDPLYKKSYAFTMNTYGFLAAVSPEISQEAKEYFDDISWHHTVVTSKVFRAVSNTVDEEDAVDARNSAAVAAKSLTICIMAFDHLSGEYASLREQCAMLSQAAREIKEEVKKRFGLIRKTT
jgi:hypothetical protein